MIRTSQCLFNCPATHIITRRRVLIQQHKAQCDVWRIFERAERDVWGVGRVGRSEGVDKRNADVVYRLDDVS
jgi:hypothetical protein